MKPIINKILIVASVIAVALIANIASANSYPLTAANKKTLNQLAADFNKLTTIKAKFEQTTSRGGYAHGRLLMKRPGKMRMQYDTTNAALIVNSSSTLWWENGGKRNIPTGKTPLSLMVKKNFSFFDSRINIIGYKETKNSVTVTMIWKPRPQDGTLSLTLSKSKPIAIKGWSISDAKGNEMRITVSNIQYGVSAANKYFHVNNPVKW